MVNYFYFSESVKKIDNNAADLLSCGFIYFLNDFSVKNGLFQVVGKRQIDFVHFLF